MSESQADSSLPGIAGAKTQAERRDEGWPAAQKPPGAGWSWQRWLTLVLLVFAAQLALIFVLGEKKFPPPRAVANVPRLTLADGSNELIALEDPTLFVLPRANDFASAGQAEMSVVTQPFLRWTEPPGELLSPDNETLGAVFTRFMRTNQFAAPTLDFQPEPELSGSVLSLPPVFAENSALQVEGELMQRKWLNPVSLTNWPYADVIAPSKVQVTVNEAGGVLSAVLLPPDNAIEVRYNAADQRALELARRLRFAPSSHLTVGLLIFNWRTVPPPATHSSATAP